MLLVQDSIKVPLRFADPDKPAGVMMAKAQDQSSMSFVEHEIEVRNGRCCDEEVSLDTTGFELVKHRTAVTDFESDEQIERIYKPEVIALVKSLTGCRRVVLFHELGRWETGEERGLRKPAGNAHIDYTVESMRTWVRQKIGDEEAEAEFSSGRWAVLNVWRGITTVERQPLAVADARTIDFDNFKDVPIHHLPGEPTPFTGRNLMHDPKQKWYYFPLMKPDEALVFRQFDSDESKPQPVAHGAINDPTSAPDAALRASYEVRAAVFF